MSDELVEPGYYPVPDVDQVSQGCPCCGAGPLQPRTLSSVLWQGDKALMVRGVPVTVCAACGEDFISDATALELDRIKRAICDGTASVISISIPVFDFATIDPDGRG